MVELSVVEGSNSTSWREQRRQKLPPVSEIDAHVGRRLRARREALGISQGRLGRELGVTFSQIQKYEKGSNRIGAGRLYHAAALLGVSVQYFFERVGEAAPAREAGAAPVPAAEAERLQDVFARISDPNARHALLLLASSMVGQPSGGSRRPD